MTRKLNLMGFAVAALMMASAYAASTAPAANFTASQYPTTLTGESAKGNEVITLEGGSVECKGHFVSSSLTEATEELAVTPTYTECRAFGFLSAGVTFKGCGFGLIPLGGWRIIPIVFCASITIHSSTCEVTIPQQERTSVDIANGSGDITMKMTISGLAYTVVKDGFGCPFAGTGSKTGGTWIQNSAVTLSSTNGASVDVG
jgi:hypothetical protein